MVNSYFLIIWSSNSSVYREEPMKLFSASSRLWKYADGLRAESAKTNKILSSTWNTTHINICKRLKKKFLYFIAIIIEHFFRSIFLQLSFHFGRVCVWEVYVCNIWTKLYVCAVRVMLIRNLFILQLSEFHDFLHILAIKEKEESQ